jgi:hypothetical protein
MATVSYGVGLVLAQAVYGEVQIKVKQSRYTAWRRLGGEEV